MRSFLTISALLLAGCQGTSAAAQTPQTGELLAELPAIIESELVRWQVPGLAVGIVKDGEVIYTGAFGYRDREAGLPVTTRTLFPVASCSKAFTSLGAAKAAAEGLIDWDRPIREYEPTFEMMDPTATREATLGDFLRHRSGFGEQRFLPRLAGISRNRLFQVLKHLEPEGEFRKRLVYSNLGYTVAGYLVGRSAGTAWEDFTRDRIFEPLEMSSTVYTVQEMEASGDYAIGYLNLFDFSHPERVGAGNLTALAPAGGIVSNLEDMVKWLQFNLGDGTANGRRLVSAETLDFLQRPHTDLSSHPDDPMVTYQGYGYAWWTETYRGFRHVHHGGLGEGYISQVSYIPEEGIGVVVLTNTYYQHLYQALIYHIFDRLLGLPEMDHFDREYSGVKGFGESWLTDFDAFFDEEPSKPHPSFPLDAYAGTYHNPAWGSVIVTEEEGRIGLTFDSGLHFTARHLEGDTFATGRDTMGLLHRTVEFRVGSQGRVEGVAIKLEAGTGPIPFVRGESR